jgi:hypothetical protein
MILILFWAQSYKKKLTYASARAKICQKGGKKACFLHKNAKKCNKNEFFFKNIWSCQKKAVPLHPVLKMTPWCYRLVA